MNISRRSFIKSSSLTLAGTSFMPEILKSRPASILGIQLYTVRDDMKKDPEGTLKKLAAIGFKDVEHAGYADRKFYGYSVTDFKKLLKDIGLKMESGHTFLGAKQWDNSSNDFTNEWKNTITDAAAVGMKFVISPGVDQSLCNNQDDFNHYLQMFNKTGELCKNAGIKFGFHNESYEIDHSIDGKTIYEQILESTDRNLVAQQIDIGNMYEPGGRALNYLKKYPGRFLLMHVKDEMKMNARKEGNIYESTLLGKGVMPVKEIVDYARKTGTKYFIIEQEEYQDKEPLECSKLDFETMKSWGF